MPTSHLLPIINVRSKLCTVSEPKIVFLKAPSLSILKSSILDLIYNTFLRGLINLELRRNTIRGVTIGTRILLYSVFIAIE